MTDTTTPTQEPSDLMKLAQNMMGAAGQADAALEAFHGRLEAMLEAVHGLVQYLVAENVELKGRLEGLEK